ncbi:MAG: orotidine-5'-phosphate decarboxylase [Chthoniobacterales bacterium]|nr:orotidine-5'-phosphate decarboxylase [Chthoniobacterales bacterium]
MKVDLKNPADRLIVALDYPRADQALQLVRTLAGEVSFFKIGLQLYTIAGPEIVRAVAATGAKVFLDLKLHDIPTTVAKAVAAAGELGVAMLTVHSSGGRKMLEKAAASVPAHTLLLGVTVLTSSDEATLQETGVNDTVGAQATRLARLGVAAGIRGLIASPHELQSLRAALGDEVTIVTPGVRPKWAVADDQRRFSTPVEAVRNGADYLVIGRPVTGHPDPLEAVRAIARELA